MQDKYLDVPQEYLNLNRAFQNPNIPEFNKQLRVSFFLYHIQEEHPDDWAKQKIPIKFITVNNLIRLIRNNRLPKQYESLQLISEMQGFITDFKTNGSKSQGFVDIIPLRLPNHPEFWKGYIDDVASNKLMEIFKRLIDESLSDAYKQNAFKESVALKESLLKYKAKGTNID